MAEATSLPALLLDVPVGAGAGSDPDITPGGYNQYGREYGNGVQDTKLPLNWRK